MSGGDEHDERDEAVVLLTSLASAFEAEVVVALLRSNDITATTSGGKGYAITGHHELMIPLLAAALIEKHS